MISVLNFTLWNKKFIKIKIDKEIILTYQEIRKLAYQFFAERNYEHGCDFDDWLKAEKIIKKRLKIFK